MSKGYTRTKEIRAERRAVAEARQEGMKEVTPEQQLAHLNAKGFRALKERAKLERRMSEAKQKAEAAAAKQAKKAAAK
jgi:hypothetical protein